MTLDSILPVVRDILVIAYMFVLRIGVPILITLMIGAWLKRLLEKEDQPQPVTPLQDSQPHCWDKRTTPETEEARAVAMARPDLPCWLALQVQGHGLKEMCYSCPQYSAHAPATVRS